MPHPPRYPLFTRFGIELEYMIVDARTLRILPRADRLIERVSGHVNGDVSRGALAWSNELALHVIEFKTDQPARSLEPLANRFQAEVSFVNGLLAAEGAMLLPTAMHPWMDPHRESRLWPHDCGEIYRAFDRLFDCRGHGWTNLQSTHLNLPFANDDEFARLHTAIRLVLPLLPALAASSPFVDGRRAPFLDLRLETYRQNCARIPSLTAHVVPEPITSQKEYEDKILGRIYRDLAPHDPDGTLQNEWANARGAIARFVRNTIEVRVLDIQECPAADLAIAQCLTAVLRRLTDGSLSSLAQQLRPRTQSLAALLRRTARDAGDARVASPDLLEALGVAAHRITTVRDLWWHLLEATAPPQAPWRPWIELILQEGSLSERILKATGPQPDHERLRMVYRQLATCLELGVPFRGPCATYVAPDRALRTGRDGCHAVPKRIWKKQGEAESVPVTFTIPRRAGGPADVASATWPLQLLLTCEHATNHIPKRFESVRRQAGQAVTTHRGFDPGALELARACSRHCRAPLIVGRCSRLLVELNRSLGHPQLWSAFSRPLSLADKSKILEAFYLPHRQAVKRQVMESLHAGRPVVHLGVHTFTPELQGQVRETDVGLLFAPHRPLEKRFCETWRAYLQRAAPQWRVRFNYPYRGVSDGLVPHLRGEFTANDYVGIELEVNQLFALRKPRLWRELQHDLAATLRQVLVESWRV